MIAAIARLARSDGALATLSNAARAVGRLAATILIARLGGVDAVGLLTITVATEAILISTLNAVFASPATVLCPGRRSSLRAIIHTQAERFQMISGLVLAAGATVAGFASGLDRVFTLILASYLPLASVYQSRRSTRLAEFRSGLVLATELLIAALGLIGPVAAPAFGISPLAAFWLAQAVAHGLGAAWLPAASPVGAPSPRAIRIARGAILRTGRAMVTGSLANSMSTRTHAFLISSVLGQSSVGIFGAGNTFAAPIRMLSGAIRGVLLPRFAQRQRRGTRVRTGRLAPMIALFAVAAAAWIAALIAPTAVQILYGDAFAEAARLVPLCVVLALTGMATSIVACARQAAGESGHVARIRVVASVASPVLFALGLFTDGLSAGLVVCVLIECASLAALCRPARSDATSASRRRLMPA